MLAMNFKQKCILTYSSDGFTNLETAKPDFSMNDECYLQYIKVNKVTKPPGFQDSRNHLMKFYNFKEVHEFSTSLLTC